MQEIVDNGVREFLIKRIRLLAGIYALPVTTARRCKVVRQDHRDNYRMEEVIGRE